MSELRTQLDQMRRAYRGSRYPGDLAAEVVSPPRGRRVDPLAIAASVLIVVGAAYLMRVAFQPRTIEYPGDAAMTVTPNNGFAVIPEFPSDLPLLPQAESLHEIGGMPEMPAIDFTFDFSTRSEPSEDLS
jgi:hypothetical protein